MFVFIFQIFRECFVKSAVRFIANNYIRAVYRFGDFASRYFGTLDRFSRCSVVDDIVFVIIVASLSVTSHVLRETAAADKSWVKNNEI